MTTSLSEQWENWPRAAAVAVDDHAVHVHLIDGRALSVPIPWFGFLDAASDSQRQDFEIIEGGEGIWWEAVDEGVSVPSLLGLPEIPPPDPTIRTYDVDYVSGDEGWLATVRGTSLTSLGTTLIETKRAIRSNLRRYLGLRSLPAAGIEVIDAVDKGLTAATR